MTQIRPLSSQIRALSSSPSPLTVTMKRPQNSGTGQTSPTKPGQDAEPEAAGAGLTGSFCSFLLVLDTDLRPDLRGGRPWNQEQLKQIPERSVLRAGSTLLCVTPQPLLVSSPEEAEGLLSNFMETADHQTPETASRCTLYTEPEAEAELMSE